MQEYVFLKLQKCLIPWSFSIDLYFKRFWCLKLLFFFFLITFHSSCANLHSHKTHFFSTPSLAFVCLVFLVYLSIFVASNTVNDSFMHTFFQLHTHHQATHFLRPKSHRTLSFTHRQLSSRATFSVRLPFILWLFVTIFCIWKRSLELSFWLTSYKWYLLILSKLQQVAWFYLSYSCRVFYYVTLPHLYSSSVGHLSCFHSLANVLSTIAAISRDVHIFFQIIFLFFER